MPVYLCLIQLYPFILSQTTVLHSTCWSFQIAAQVFTAAGQRSHRLFISLLAVRVSRGVWIFTVTPTSKIWFCIQHKQEDDRDGFAQQFGIMWLNKSTETSLESCVCMCVSLHLSPSPRGSSWRGHLSSVVQLPSSPPLTNTTQTFMKPVHRPLEMKTCEADYLQIRVSIPRVIPKPAVYRSTEPYTHLRWASASRFSFSSISRAWRCVPSWPACCCGGREAYEPLRPGNPNAAPSAGPSRLRHKTNTAPLK